MGPRMREDNGSGEVFHGGGLFAVTTEGGECGWWEWDGRFPNRSYGEGEDGSPHPRGQRRGESVSGAGGSRTAPTERAKMGPRIHEDNGGGRVGRAVPEPPLRRGRRWVPASTRTTEGGEWEWGGRFPNRPYGEGEDGSPHARGHGSGEVFHGGGLWVGAAGGGSGTGGLRIVSTERAKMDPRIREDNGGGASRLAGSSRGNNGRGNVVGHGRFTPTAPSSRGQARRWVPASARTTEGRCHGAERALRIVTTEGGEWDGCGSRTAFATERGGGMGV